MTAAVVLAPEIRAAQTRFDSAFERGDIAAIVTLYQRGAQLLPTHGDLVTGATAIEAYWRGLREMEVHAVDRDIADAYVYDATVIAIGEFTFRSGDGFVVERGTSVTVWREHEPGWKLYRDIWNADSWSLDVAGVVNGR